MKSARVFAFVLVAAAGFAQAILVLRHNYAPHVIVGYHDSIWGTGKDIHDSHPTG